MCGIKARVYRSAQREFECRILETGQVVKACALGNLLKKDETVVAGDYVRLQAGAKGEYTIMEVEKRRNELFRILPREGKRKVTAANCDLLLIITSVSKPEYKRGIIDRFLVRAYQWGIQPIVVFNKMDQYDASLLDINFESQRLLPIDVKCFELSAKFGDYQSRYLPGREQLKELLANTTAVMLGQSGVGKSRLISALTDNEVELKTQQIGKKGKGIHTTTWSELIDFNNFTLIDSPGIRSFSLEDLVGEDLISYFPDLAEVATGCKFANCSHKENARGCAFAQADTLLRSRLDSFLRLKEELDVIPAWNKKI